MWTNSLVALLGDDPVLDEGHQKIETISRKIAMKSSTLEFTFAFYPSNGNGEFCFSYQRIIVVTYASVASCISIKCGALAANTIGMADSKWLLLSVQEKF